MHTHALRHQATAKTGRSKPVARGGKHETPQLKGKGKAKLAASPQKQKTHSAPKPSGKAAKAGPVKSRPAKAGKVSSQKPSNKPSGKPQAKPAKAPTAKKSQPVSTAKKGKSKR